MNCGEEVNATALEDAWGPIPELIAGAGRLFRRMGEDLFDAGVSFMPVAPDVADVGVGGT